MLGGIAHLPRFIDKVRLRHAGKIQDYNYITTGFDKYLLEFLQIEPDAFEKEVLAERNDDQILAWVQAHARPFSAEELAQWNDRISHAGPKDESARERFQTRLVEVAKKRGVPVETLPNATTWADLIELDEARM